MPINGMGYLRFAVTLSGTVHKTFKTFDGASHYVRRKPDLIKCEIIETGEGYWSDRVVKCWRFNEHRRRWQQWNIERDTWR